MDLSCGQLQAVLKFHTNGTLSGNFPTMNSLYQLLSIIYNTRWNTNLNECMYDGMHMIHTYCKRKGKLYKSMVPTFEEKI